MAESGRVSGEPKAMRPIYVLGAIAIAALALRMGTLVRPGHGWALFVGDSKEYIELARGLNAGCGFAHLTDGRCGPPELRRTPGYPLFLAAMPGVRTAIAAQGLISALVCLAAGVFVWSQWGLAAGAIAEALLAFDIPSIVAAGTVMSDWLFTAMLAAGVILELCAIGRARRGAPGFALALLASGFLAAALIVRPIGILILLLAPAPFMALREARWRTRMGFALAALCIPVLAMGGWTVRNGMRGRIWTLSTIGSYQLYYYRAAGVVWYRTGESMISVQNRFAHDVGLAQASYTFPPRVYREMIDRGVAVMLRDPAAAAIMTARCMLYVAVDPDRLSLSQFLRLDNGASHVLYPASGELERRIRDLLRSPLLSLLVAIQLPLTGLVWAGALMAVWRLRQSAPADILPELYFLAIALTLIFLAAGPEGVARYRVPAMPFLAMLAGIGWSGWLHAHRLIGQRGSTTPERPKDVSAAVNQL